MTENERTMAGLFAAVWDVFMGGIGIEACDIETLLDRCPELCQWRKATQADVDASGLELDVGDPLLCLTDLGQLIVREGRNEAVK